MTKIGVSDVLSIMTQPLTGGDQGKGDHVSFCFQKKLITPTQTLPRQLGGLFEKLRRLLDKL
jgi:hypothetical protein